MEAPYVIEWSGSLPLEELRTSYEPGARPEFGPEEEQALWDMLERREAAGQHLTRRPDGGLPDLYRMTGFRVGQGVLEVELGRTDYAEYLLTNVEHPEWRAERGARVMADALAVSAVLLTSDGQVAWGERSARILDSSARYHVLPSGHPEPPGTVAEGLLQELREEAGFLPAEIVEGHWTGLLRSIRTGKPELTAFLRASAPFTAIEEREREGAWEFERLFALPWTPEAARAWLVEHQADAVPPGHAAVLLAGTEAFGTEWRARCDRELRA